jgi:hypothetical protein
MKRRLTAGIAVLLGLAACSSVPEAPVHRPAAARAPEGCGKDFAADTPLLTLAPTRAPTASSRKSQPFQFANEIRIRSPLAQEGLWTDFDDGWSSLTLRIASADATSLALHLTALRLPERSQIWFCSADGRFRQGPYREAVGGELWTPVVLGAEALLQIDVPTLARAEFEGELAEAFGGFR